MENAIEEMDICNEINLEQLVNENKCPTKIVSAPRASSLGCGSEKLTREKYGRKF